MLIVCLHDLKRMDTVIRGVQFLVSGAATNWWGLGCPSHCGAPSLPLLFTVLLLGTCFGLLLAILLGAWLFFPSWTSASSPPVASSDLPVARLRAYVHGRAAISKHRQRDD